MLFFQQSIQRGIPRQHWLRSKCYQNQCSLFTLERVGLFCETNEKKKICNMMNVKTEAPDIGDAIKHDDAIEQLLPQWLEEYLKDEEVLYEKYKRHASIFRHWSLYRLSDFYRLLINGTFEDVTKILRHSVFYEMFRTLSYTERFKTQEDFRKHWESVNNSLIANSNNNSNNNNNNNNNNTNATTTKKRRSSISSILNAGRRASIRPAMKHERIIQYDMNAARLLYLWTYDPIKAGDDMKRTQKASKRAFYPLKDKISPYGSIRVIDLWTKPPGWFNIVLKLETMFKYDAPIIAHEFKRAFFKWYTRVYEDLWFDYRFSNRRQPDKKAIKHNKVDAVDPKKEPRRRNDHVTAGDNDQIRSLLHCHLENGSYLVYPNELFEYLLKGGGPMWYRYIVEFELQIHPYYTEKHVLESNGCIVEFLPYYASYYHPYWMEPDDRVFLRKRQFCAGMYIY
ncbi:hypothetical protein RFI_16151, partial [Reticulomyxa filosa]